MVTKREKRSEVALAPSSTRVVVVVAFCASVERDKLGWAEWEIEPACNPNNRQGPGQSPNLA